MHRYLHTYAHAHTQRHILSHTLKHTLTLTIHILGTQIHTSHSFPPFYAPVLLISLFFLSLSHLPFHPLIRITQWQPGSSVPVPVCGVVLTPPIPFFITTTGQRVPTMISGKSLPSFRAYDCSARSGGFVQDRFLTGVCALLLSM